MFGTPEPETGTGPSPQRHRRAHQTSGHHEYIIQHNTVMPFHEASVRRSKIPITCDTLVPLSFKAWPLRPLQYTHAPRLYSTVQVLQLAIRMGKHQCSVSSQVLPTVRTRSSLVMPFPLVKYPAAIFASISTRESIGIRCSTRVLDH